MRPTGNIHMVGPERLKQF